MAFRIGIDLARRRQEKQATEDRNFNRLVSTFSLIPKTDTASRQRILDQISDTSSGTIPRVSLEQGESLMGVLAPSLKAHAEGKIDKNEVLERINLLGLQRPEEAAGLGKFAKGFEERGTAQEFQQIQAISGLPEEQFIAGGGERAISELLAKSPKGREVLGKQLAPVSGREQARTVQIRDEEGKVQVMQFNKNTGAFDIPVGEAPASFRDDLRVINMRTEIIKNFNADPAVRRGESMITSANTIIDAVASNNPVANAALPTLMARASGEVGNLSEADKAPFGGSRALQARMKQVAKELSTGLRTEENLKFIEELAEIFKATGQRAKTRIAKERSKQFGKGNRLLKEEEILEFLAPQFVLEQAKGDKEALKSKYGLE